MHFIAIIWIYKSNISGFYFHQTNQILRFYCCINSWYIIFRAFCITILLCTRCLRRIMAYCWYDFMSNQQLFCKTDSRPITTIVRQRQLRLYGHVACYPEADPAYWVVSERDNPAWRRPRGHPQNSWLQQVDASCLELLSMRRVPAWRLVRCDRREWRHRVGKTTHPLAYAPYDWLTDFTLLEINYPGVSETHG